MHLTKQGIVDKDRVVAAFILGNEETYDFALTGIPQLGPVDEIISPFCCRTEFQTLLLLMAV